MEVTKTIIQEARITDVKDKTLIDIILRMKSDFENCEVYIESPHKELLSVKLSNFSEHISFERFINIIKNYKLFDILFNNCEIVGVGSVIRYTEILFTALFDRGSGELLKVTQPNASEPKLVIEFKKDINVVKQLIFSGQGDDDYVNK